MPAPLLEELTRGRWLPLVGAGLSKNAIVPSGKAPLDWRELGEALAEDVPSYVFDNSLDAITSYEYAFGRIALIERIGSLLRVHEAMPGPAHTAFARLGFKNVFTTNFDMLLEKAYDSVGRSCLPLVEEVQLSGFNPYTGPTLLKLHGDMHHPLRMVVTEDDYAGFLRRQPLIATHLAASLIGHSAVLIGYSLDDPDLRQVLSLLRDRLGSMTKPMWTIQVDVQAQVADRYNRRNVKVVNLKKQRGMSYGDTLADFFTALQEFWQREVIEGSQSTDEQTLADLRLPPDNSKACYFAVPLELVSWYRETVFPIVRAHGLVPVLARDVLTPGETLSVKIDALIGRARLVVVDVSSASSTYEIRLALASKQVADVLIVQPASAVRLYDLHDLLALRRPDDLTESADSFISEFTSWLSRSGASDSRRDLDEADRLVRAGEYRAALVAIVSTMEWELASRFGQIEGSKGRYTSLGNMMRAVVAEGLVEPQAYEGAAAALRLRNEALHAARDISASEARAAIKAVRRFLAEIG